MDRFQETKVTKSEYFSSQQEEEESIGHFARRVEEAGRSLKIERRVRYAMFQRGIRKHAKSMLTAMVGREEEITGKLIEGLMSIEELEKQTVRPRTGSQKQRTGRRRSSPGPNKRDWMFKNGM